MQSPSPPRLPIRIGLAEQVALYFVFHRDSTNRAIHAVTVPAILFSGMMLLAPLRLGSWSFTLDAGLAIVLLAVFAEARLDLVFGLAAAAWALPMAWLCQRVASGASLGAVLALNAIVQAVSWYLTVKVGHEAFEARLPASNEGAGSVSSNVYFDRGYFVLRNVGRETSVLESFQQFAIGPFAMTLELLFALGYRPALRAEVDALREEYIARIARGEDVMAPCDRAPERREATSLQVTFSRPSRP